MSHVDELLAERPPPDYRPVLQHPRSRTVHLQDENRRTVTACGIHVDGAWHRAYAVDLPVTCRRRSCEVA